MSGRRKLFSPVGESLGRPVGQVSRLAGSKQEKGTLSLPAARTTMMMMTTTTGKPLSGELIR